MAEKKKALTRFVHLARPGKGETNYEIVTINGKRWQIMRGVTVEVPYPVYAILRERKIAMEIRDAFVETHGQSY